MKRILIYLMALCLSLVFYPVHSNAAATPGVINPDSSAVSSMVLRINEIKMMDKSTLNRAEKKSLRKELREIKKNLRGSNNGVYLSVGAIIIIILLLILIL